MTRWVAAARAGVESFLAGVGKLFYVLYHTPHGC